MKLGVPSVQSVLGFVAATAFGLSLLLAVTYAPPALPQAPLPTLDQLISGGLEEITSVEIAPMATAGEATPGTWLGVPNGAFSGMLAYAGIIPGQTVPSAAMSGRTGFIDFIDDSKVLNGEVANADGSVTPAGIRSTFGFFVRTKGLVSEFTVTNEVFVLMSYDYRLVDGEPKVAFEVFIFQMPGTLGFQPDASGRYPLVAGVAVDPSGQTLSSVPLTIADVFNYKGNKVTPGTAVTPGVTTQGFGCLACHARDDEFTGRTGPFPWRSKVAEVPVPPPPVLNSPAPANCPPETPAAPAGATPGGSPGSTPAGSPDGHGSAGQRPMLGGVLCGLGVRTPGPAQPGKEDDRDREDRDDH